MLDDATSPETHAIIGALLEVHHHLGPGLLEAVYQWATELEFGFRGIPSVREPPIRIVYKATRRHGPTGPTSSAMAASSWS